MVMIAAVLTAAVTWEAITAAGLAVTIVVVAVGTHRAAHRAAQTLEEIAAARTLAQEAVEDLIAKTSPQQQDNQTSKQEMQE